MFQQDKEDTWRWYTVRAYNALHHIITGATYNIIKKTCGSGVIWRIGEINSLNNLQFLVSYHNKCYQHQAMEFFFGIMWFQPRSLCLFGKQSETWYHQENICLRKDFLVKRKTYMLDAKKNWKLLHIYFLNVSGFQEFDLFTVVGYFLRYWRIMREQKDFQGLEVETKKVGMLYDW